MDSFRALLRIALFGLAAASPLSQPRAGFFIPSGNGDDAGETAAPRERVPGLGGAPSHGSAANGAPAYQPSELKKALSPRPPEIVRKELLDSLFQQLSAAQNPEAARQVAESIERLWLKSISDTATLLMQRAGEAARAGQFPLALSIFDKLVIIEPEWAEAWNQRATARFHAGDMDGAMADINQALKLEPRHFGALTGMGVILRSAGLGERALQVFKKAQSLYPLNPDIQKQIENLTREIEGQDI
ncbi:MAG TPA: tetratricopeptide repeat protein [Methylocella sp.]|nr:tetratricopeptide repeat protein [Methylocella sp.]